MSDDDDDNDNVEGLTHIKKAQHKVSDQSRAEKSLYTFLFSDVVDRRVP